MKPPANVKEPFMLRHSRHLAVLLVSVLVLAISVKGCYIATHETSGALPKGYPTREVVDTKQFERLLLNDSLTLVVVNAYYAAFPKEMGLCIYGHYSPDKSIIVEGLDADSVYTRESQVRIFCTEAKGEGAPIIGNIHSHPMARNPAYPCVPSQQDYFSLLTGNLGVQVIYCANGSGVTMFRDGRWWNFAWR